MAGFHYHEQDLFPTKTVWTFHQTGSFGFSGTSPVGVEGFWNHDLACPTTLVDWLFALFSFTWMFEAIWVRELSSARMTSLKVTRKFSSVKLTPELWRFYVQYNWHPFCVKLYIEERLPRATALVTLLLGLRWSRVWELPPPWTKPPFLWTQRSVAN